MVGVQCIPDDVLLKVRLRIVENVLHQPKQEYWQSQQHKEPGHKPGGPLGVALLSAEVVDKQRKGHHQQGQVEGSHSRLAPASPAIPA